jgi:transposase, IS30 family
LYRDSRGIIPNRVSIEKRPEIINKRKRVGDIEVDLMMGKNHKGALLVMTDRTTLKTQLELLQSKDSKTIAHKKTKRLKPYQSIIKNSYL